MLNTPKPSHAVYWTDIDSTSKPKLPLIRIPKDEVETWVNNLYQAAIEENGDKVSELLSNAPNSSVLPKIRWTVTTWIYLLNLPNGYGGSIALKLVTAETVEPANELMKHAALYGHTTLVNLMLKQRFLGKDEAFVYACRGGHWNIASILYANSANKYAMGYYNAVYWAAHGGHFHVLDELTQIWVSKKVIRKDTPDFADSLLSGFKDGLNFYNEKHRLKLPAELNLSSYHLRDTAELQALLTIALSKNSPVTALYLSQNQLGKLTGATLGKLLPQNTKLTILDLSDNQLGGSYYMHSGLTLLAPGLQRNTSLHTLILSHNQINDTDVKYLIEKLAVTRGLESLVLSGNAITDIGAYALLELIRKHPTLRQVSLEKNSINTDVLDKIYQLLNQKTQKINQIIHKEKKRHPEAQEIVHLSTDPVTSRREEDPRVINYFYKIQDILKPVLELTHNHEQILLKDLEKLKRIKKAIKETHREIAAIEKSRQEGKEQANYKELHESLSNELKQYEKQLQDMQEIIAGNVQQTPQYALAYFLYYIQKMVRKDEVHYADERHNLTHLLQQPFYVQEWADYYEALLKKYSEHFKSLNEFQTIQKVHQDLTSFCETIQKNEEQRNRSLLQKHQQRYILKSMRTAIRWRLSRYWLALDLLETEWLQAAPSEIEKTIHNTKLLAAIGLLLSHADHIGKGIHGIGTTLIELGKETVENFHHLEFLLELPIFHSLSEKLSHYWHEIGGLSEAHQLAAFRDSFEDWDDCQTHCEGFIEHLFFTYQEQFQKIHPRDIKTVITFIASLSLIYLRLGLHDQKSCSPYKDYVSWIFFSSAYLSPYIYGKNMPQIQYENAFIPIHQLFSLPGLQCEVFFTQEDGRQEKQVVTFDMTIKSFEVKHGEAFQTASKKFGCRKALSHEVDELKVALKTKEQSQQPGQIISFQIINLSTNSTEMSFHATSCPWKSKAQENKELKNVVSELKNEVSENKNEIQSLKIQIKKTEKQCNRKLVTQAKIFCDMINVIQDEINLPRTAYQDIAIQLSNQITHLSEEEDNESDGLSHQMPNNKTETPQILNEIKSPQMPFQEKKRQNSSAKDIKLWNKPKIPANNDGKPVSYQKDNLPSDDDKDNLTHKNDTSSNSKILMMMQ